MESENGFRDPGIYGNGVKLFAITVVLQIVVWISIAIRFISRNMSLAGVGLDDYMIVASGVSKQISSSLVTSRDSLLLDSRYHYDFIDDHRQVLI
jgi:hypothetical protein